jgi:pimeloyl-ACP methyl ester carboxylesterase
MSTRSTTTPDGVALAVEEAGEGTPVVLLHGLTATRRYVVMGSKALERAGHRVLAYDARGHGESAPAPSPDRYGYDELAADLGAVLDDAGFDRAVLAGASMGAHTAVRCALDHPERVVALALITPAFDPASPGGGMERWDRLAAGLREGGIDGFVAAEDHSRLSPDFRERVEEVQRQRLARHEHLDAVADALRCVPRSRPFESREELGEVGAPTVVVASRDEADPTHPFAVGEMYAATIPGAELVTEEPGKSPLAWQGGQLSKVIASLAERAAV